MFFLSAAVEWNNLDHNIGNAGSFSAFKNNILRFIRSTPNNDFNWENHRGIKLITRLRVGLSHLCKQNSRYFKSYLQLRFWCWIDFSFYSPLFHDEKHTLLSTTKNIDYRLLDVIGTVLINTFLFGNCFVNTHTNTQILNATIEYILTTKTFDESLFYSRDLKVDGCQSNLYFMLKQLLFFYKFYNFFGRCHSLINQPCYNNIFQFIQHESRVNTFWYCFPVIRRYTFHYLMKWALILGNQSSFEILQLSAIWRYQSLVTLFFSSVVILI